MNRKIHEWKIWRNRRRILILEDLKVGYVPTYKVASSSLRKMLCRRQAEIFYPHLLDADSSVVKKQVEGHIRRSFGVRGIRRLKEMYFLFAFVRNPITRLYSCYLHKVIQARKKDRRFRLSRFGIRPDMQFEEFARHIAGIPDSVADKHFRSQHFEIYHSGEWLVDFVGKFENLEADWQRLADKIGMKEKPGMTNCTGAGNGLDKLPLSLEAAEVIVRRYRMDIDLLGYRDEIDKWLTRKASNSSQAPVDNLPPQRQAG